MPPRLQSSILASALVRKAEADGGFGAVIAKGDPIAGEILLVLAERGERRFVLQKRLDSAGHYVWDEAGALQVRASNDIEDLLAARRRFDPDLWILELDVPSPERFAAEMTTFN